VKPSSLIRPHCIFILGPNESTLYKAGTYATKEYLPHLPGNNKAINVIQFLVFRWNCSVLGRNNGRRRTLCLFRKIGSLSNHLIKYMNTGRQSENVRVKTCKIEIAMYMALSYAPFRKISNSAQCGRFALIL